MITMVTIGVAWVEIVVLSDYNRIVYDVVTIGIPWGETDVLCYCNRDTSDYNGYTMHTIDLPIL